MATLRLFLLGHTGADRPAPLDLMRDSAISVFIHQAVSPTDGPSVVPPSPFDLAFSFDALLRTGGLAVRFEPLSAASLGS